MTFHPLTGSYGSLARFKNLERIRSAGRFTAIGGSGEYSDFQTLMVGIDNLIDHDFDEDDGIEKTPKQIYSYVSQVMYNRRNNMDPYYNQLVIGGYHNEKPFLGYVDLQGIKKLKKLDFFFFYSFFIYRNQF